MIRTFSPESYGKLLAEYQPKIITMDARDTTTEALAEVIGSLEIALQIVNGDSASETLRDRTISKT
ncbi:MAG: hypothetical protein RMX65_023915 [Nostoc sp. DedQUE01]|nr:hypothetical protein [Nostoc sp. DedQUE01]